MAAPVIEASGNTNIATAATSHTINVGAPNAGWLTIVFVRFASAPGTVTFTGYTQLVSDSSDATDDETRIYYRWTDGTEGITDVMSTTNSVKLATIHYCLSGAENPSVAPPTVSAVAIGTTTANLAGPNSVAPTGAPRDTTYLAFAGGDGESAYTAPPTNYTALKVANSGTGGAVATNVFCGAGSRQITGSSSDDAGAFTHPAHSTGWTSFAVAVFAPAPSTPVSGSDSGIGTDNFQLTGRPQLTATFETGVDGSAISTSDAGSTVAWDAVSLGSGATAVYEDDVSPYEAMAARLGTGGTAAHTYLEWSTAYATVAGITYGRIYIYQPSGGNRYYYGVHLMQDGNVAAQFLFPSGNVDLWTGFAHVVTGSVFIPTNQWVRLEWYVKHDASAGQMGYRLYLNADSTGTPDESYDSAATLNTRAYSNAIRYGLIPANNAASLDFQLDNIVAGATDWPGKFTPPATPKSDTETGSGADSISSRVSGVAESGTGADAISLSTRAVVDTGTGSDTATATSTQQITVSERATSTLAPYANLLDSFPTNGGPPPAGWSNWNNWQFTVSGNQLAPIDTGWNDTYFLTAQPADLMAWIEIPTLPVTDAATYLFARLDPAAGNGYAIQHYVSSGDDAINIRRFDGGTPTNLGSFAAPIAAGDAIAIVCVGSTIQAWARISGSWSFVGSVTDSTYAGTGTNNKIGILHYGNGSTVARFDNLNGGAQALPGITENAIVAKSLIVTDGNYKTYDFSEYALDEVWTSPSSHGKLEVPPLFTGCWYQTVDDPAGNRVIEMVSAEAATAGETYAGAIKTVENFGDHEFTVRYKTLEHTRTSGPANPWEVAWILFRYVDDDHFYWFLHLTDGTWEIGRGDPAYGGGQRFLASGSLGAPHNLNQWYTARIRVIESRITVWLDGSLVGTVEDTYDGIGKNPSHFLNGAITPYVEDAKAHYDDIAVTRYDDAISALVRQIPETALGAEVISDSRVITDSGTGADTGLPAYNVTDSNGATTENALVTVPISATDSGTSVDAISAFTRELPDTGSETDTSTGAAAYTVTDAGTETDASTLSTALTATDSGTDSENASTITTQQLSGSDSGTGADASSLAAQYGVTDTGTASETISSLIREIADSGIGADASTLTSGSLKSDTDTGIGAENISALAQQITDSGTAIESPGISIIQTDAGVGAETPQIFQAATDTGTGIDTSVISLVAIDTGTSTDVAGNGLVATEAGTSVEVISTLTRQITETASGIDDSVLSAGNAKSGSDTGSGTDASALTTAFTATDTGSGADTASRIAILVSDTGTSTETGVLTRTEIIVDAGFGGDTASLASADTKTGTDSGASVDSAAISITVNEVGILVDASALVTFPIVTDSGIGFDETGLRRVAVTEIATGSDFGVISQGFTVSDMGGATENYYLATFVAEFEMQGSVLVSARSANDRSKLVNVN